MKFLSNARIFLISFFLIASLQGYAQSSFEDFFTKGRLRMDFNLTGNSESIVVANPGYYREGDWGGSRINLVDTFRYGEMMLEVFDAKTEELIYSRGFSTLFQEWQTTSEADSLRRQFTETVLMPYPLRTVRIVLSVREHGEFRAMLSSEYDPSRVRIRKKQAPGSYELETIRESGSHEEKLDILLLAEGYTDAEKEKFITTAKSLVSGFMEYEPYASYPDEINFYAVFIPSAESGVDDPANSKEVDSPLACSYNTFGSDRYLTSKEPGKIFDYASELPYDQLIILVNDEKYGGGAIYNRYTFLSAENENALFLMLHEFGHSFGALADEYYTSSVAYEEFFDLEVEPWQPNITTLVDFNKKWPTMIADTVPVPTPDSLRYSDVVGVYEGAGYMAKGIYRPYRTCIMKARVDAFCPVCQRAIGELIEFY